MSHFGYVDGQLCADGVPLSELAGQFGTPLYVYSRAAIEGNWRAYADALAGRPHLICYAVKANGNLAVLDALARLGSGFDIVSAGELERVLRAGGDAGKVVFSGVGKGAEEMRRALEAGVRCFNVESAAELERLNGVAGASGARAPVSLRVNPDVDPETHPYIATGLRRSKFGIPFDEALTQYRTAAGLRHIEIRGLACHIGSQITSLDPYRDAVRRLAELVQQLKGEGIRLQHVDFGGGLAIRYGDESPPRPAQLVQAICEEFGDASMEILIEPGRSIVGDAGVLLTRVEYLKTNGDRHFVVVDAAMNDLLRPALYNAWHEVRPVAQNQGGAATVSDVVGPVCESGDFLALDRELAVREGDLLAVSAAGAYGFAMSSNYNARPRAAEVMIDGGSPREVRRRESPDDLMRGERLPGE